MDCRQITIFDVLQDAVDTKKPENEFKTQMNTKAEKSSIDEALALLAHATTKLEQTSYVSFKENNEKLNKDIPAADPAANIAPAVIPVAESETLKDISVNTEENTSVETGRADVSETIVSQIEDEPAKVEVKAETGADASLAKEKKAKEKAEKPAPKKPYRYTAKKKDIPECLAKLSNVSTAQRIINTLISMKYGITVEPDFLPIYSKGWCRGKVAGNNLIDDGNEHHYGVVLTREGLFTRENCLSLAYLDEDGDLWESEMKIITSYHYQSKNNTIALSIDKWRCINKLLFNPVFIQPDDEIEERLKAHAPYTYAWCQEEEMEIESICRVIMAPQLEQLCKAGYAFASQALHANYDKTLIDMFNRLCQPGKNMKEIFKTAKPVYLALKSESRLPRWDVFRKMEKQGALTQDIVYEVAAGNYDENDIRILGEIMTRKYADKLIFTWESLNNYLQRLDFFEAISRREALPLLRDYLSMCSQLRMKPRIDGDSLKREHDVAARTLRQKRSEIMDQKMKEKCVENAKLNYGEKVFFIRAIESHDDLLNEATNQHNCVASYASRIADGSSRIYVMRETAHPDTSLITVELAGNRSEIRQKLLAFNQPIRNKAQTEFLERWLKFVRSTSKNR